MQEGRRILVVEDDRLNAKLLADMLELAGWQVVGPVGRLSEAMDIAASDDFAAAVLDINLDGEEVFPVAEVLNERRIPFVFLTGNDAKAAKRPFREQPLLRKPFKLAELIDAVARLFTPAKAQRRMAAVPIEKRRSCEPQGKVMEADTGARVKRWRDRAEELRTLADQFRNPDQRMTLYRIAETYDSLADAAEAQLGKMPRPPRAEAG